MYEKVWPLIEAGKLAPLIHATVGDGEGEVMGRCLWMKWYARIR